MSKRAREPSPSDNAQSKRTRTIFSYTEGSKRSTAQWTSNDIIVLQAMGKTESVFLEASRSLLTRESPFFADLFALPPLPSADYQDSHDGKPLIRCHDEPGDLEKFIEATHDYRVYFRHEKWKEFSSVAAILRLATKYQAHHLRAKMIEHMATIYPSKLEPFHESLSLETPGSNAERHFRSLRLFQETNATALLPAAFFKCLRALSTLEVIDIPVAPKESEGDVWVADHATRTMLIKALLELEQFSAFNLKHIAHMVLDRHPIGEAAHVEDCPQKVLKWIASTPALNSHQRALDDPAILMERLESLELYNGCLVNIESSLQRKMETMWYSLPSLFGLPAWGTMLADEEAAMEEE